MILSIDYINNEVRMGFFQEYGVLWENDAGKFISKMRNELKIGTQLNLAEQLGVKQNTVAKWECGKNKPPEYLFLALKNLFSKEGNNQNLLKERTDFERQYESMISRFFSLFEANGIKAYDAKKILPNCNPSDIYNHSALLDEILDDETIGTLAKIFEINENWLKAKEDRVYNSTNKRWHNSIDCLMKGLIKARKESNDPIVYFCIKQWTCKDVLRKARGKNGYDDKIVVSPLIYYDKEYNGAEIPIYDLLSSEDWNYKETRLNAKLMMYLCEEIGVHHSFKLLPEEELKLIENDRITIRKELLSRSCNTPSYFLVTDNEDNTERDEFEDVKEMYDKLDLEGYFDNVRKEYNSRNFSSRET